MIKRSERILAKRGQIVDLTIKEHEFPHVGIAYTEEGYPIYIKGVFEGQKIRARISKKRRTYGEANLIEVVEKADFEKEAFCKDFGKCGGCTYQTIDYEKQLEKKKIQVQKLLEEQDLGTYEFLGIEGSPDIYNYRNKMEFSFGDETKGGELALGMHKKGSFYDIVVVDECHIVDEDFRSILTTTLEHFKKRNIPYYSTHRHEGYLRHLVVRKASNTQEILINLVTTTQLDFDLKEWKEEIQQLKLTGELKGILHTLNDSLADVVQSDETKILYGQDFITENVLGLNFKISAFSFFQTNSKGAERLYSIVREFVGDADQKTVFDLYCGTGTIGQIVAQNAKKVYGIELVEEAVKAANENATRNNLTNCHFIAGDVFEKIDELTEKPDIIIVDPPRAGIHPKALQKITAFGTKQIVYVSCNPKTLAVDLKGFVQAGYKVEKVKCMDMFPHTPHVETVVLLSHKKADTHINVNVEFGEGEGKIPVGKIVEKSENQRPSERVTYKMIQEYIESKYGFKVHTSYIAEVKRDLGLPMYDAPNTVEELKNPRKHPTPEKVKAIKDALKYFEIIVE